MHFGKLSQIQTFLNAIIITTFSILVELLMSSEIDDSDSDSWGDNSKMYDRDKVKSLNWSEKSIPNLSLVQPKMNRSKLHSTFHIWKFQLVLDYKMICNFLVLSLSSPQKLKRSTTKGPIGLHSLTKKQTLESKRSFLKTKVHLFQSTMPKENNMHGEQLKCYKPNRFIRDIKPLVTELPKPSTTIEITKRNQIGIKGVKKVCFQFSHSSSNVLWKWVEL